MTKEELHQKLEEANETMKAYYSYPPDKVIKMKKAKFNERHMDSAFYIQLGMGEIKRGYVFKFHNYSIFYPLNINYYHNHLSKLHHFYVPSS